MKRQQQHGTAEALKVEMWNIEDIKPYPANPRKISPRAVDAVARSISRFGFRVPLILDRHGVIIAGHTRLLAAQQLGLKQVPVHVAQNLTAAQARALRIADNQTATIAEWNEELLAQEDITAFPEVQSVEHVTEAQALEQGFDVRAVMTGTGDVPGAYTRGNGISGTSKLVVDASRHVVVGATFTGPDVQELLHSATIAIVGEVPVETLWHAVPSFPTVSEVWLRLLEAYGL